MSNEAQNWVRQNSQTMGTARTILMILADMASSHPGHANQVAWPSVATIANEISRSERTVQRAIRQAEALGEIRRVVPDQLWKGRQDRTPNAYEFLELHGVTSVTPRRSSRGDRSDGHGVTSVTPRGDTGVTQTIRENHKKKPKKNGVTQMSPRRPATGTVKKRRISQKASEKNNADSLQPSEARKARKVSTQRYGGVTRMSPREDETWREAFPDMAGYRNCRTREEAQQLSDNVETIKQDTEQETDIQALATTIGRKRKP